MTGTASSRAWAYTGAVLGGLVSIAANIAHSFIPPTPPEGAPADWAQTWAPELGAVVGAVVWPVFLFIAVEILARVAWPAGSKWLLVRWAGVLPVALVAALVSYRHLSGLLHHYGEEPIVVRLGPLAVDGLMVMATGAILATGGHRRTPATPTTLIDPSATSDTLSELALDVTKESSFSIGAMSIPGLTDLVETPDDGNDDPVDAVDIADSAPVDPAPVDMPAHLLPTARFAVVNHEQTTGRTITVDELAARMSITPATAGQLLNAVNRPARINGTPVGGAR